MTQTGLLTWSPTWSSSIAGCPLTFEIGRIVNSVEQALTSHETAALTHSAVDGSLQLLSNDFALATEVWTIKLYKKSTYSTAADGEGVFQFDITFRDLCWDSILEPAVFSQSVYEFSKQQAFTMTFSPMVDTSQGLACGGYTYEFEYLNTGPLYSGSAPDLSFLNISGNSVSGSVPSASWIGTHPLRLKCTNG